MRVIKFVCLFALLLCLTETCLVLAEDGNPNKCGYLVRCKREVDKEAQQANSRIQRSLFSMLKKAGSPKPPHPPPTG